MQDTSRDDKALGLPQFNAASFQIDNETTLDDKEKLIIVVVLVPVIFSLDNAEPDDRTVDLAKSLICTICPCRRRSMPAHPPVPTADNRHSGAWRTDITALPA